MNTRRGGLLPPPPRRHVTSLGGRGKAPTRHYKARGPKRKRIGSGIALKAARPPPGLRRGRGSHGYTGRRAQECSRGAVQNAPRTRAGGGANAPQEWNGHRGDRAKQKKPEEKLQIT